MNELFIKYELILCLLSGAITALLLVRFYFNRNQSNQTSNFYLGQRCTTLRRLFIHKSLYETIVQRLIKAYPQVWPQFLKFYIKISESNFQVRCKIFRFVSEIL